MANGTNKAYAWRDYTDFTDINSVEDLRQLIGADSITGVDLCSHTDNAVNLKGDSIIITFAIPHTLKYKIDTTVTQKDLSSTIQLSFPTLTSISEINVGALPQELYRTNGAQLFYSEMSNNDVSQGANISQPSIKVTAPTGALLAWAQINNYGVQGKSFQGPLAKATSLTGPYHFNNSSLTSMPERMPAEFGLNDSDYRILAVNWNEGSCTQARIENGYLIYTINGQETSVEVTSEVAENYTGLYVFNKISNVEGQTSNVYTAGEKETPITGGTRRDIILSLSPQLNITILEDLQPLATYDHGAEVKEVIINKYYHNIPFSLSIKNNWTNSVFISSIGGYLNYFKYSASTGLINITYQGYTDILPTFDLKQSSHSINGFDEPWFNNPEGGVGNTVYSITTTINWLNSKMFSPFSTNTYTYGQHLNDAGKTFFTYFNYYNHNITNRYYYGNCWLYFSSNKTFTFPSTSATVTLKTNPGFLSNFHADSNSDNKIFMPGNTSLNNLTPPYIINNVNQLRAEYTVPTSFDTGYIIVAVLKRPS